MVRQTLQSTAAITASARSRRCTSCIPTGAAPNPDSGRRAGRRAGTSPFRSPLGRPLRLHVVDGGTEPDERLHQLVAVGRPRTQILDATDHLRLDPAKQGRPRGSGATPPPAGPRPRPTGPAVPALPGPRPPRSPSACRRPVARPRGRPLVARGDGREHPVVGQADSPDARSSTRVARANARTASTSLDRTWGSSSASADFRHRTAPAYQDSSVIEPSRRWDQGQDLFVLRRGSDGYRKDREPPQKCSSTPPTDPTPERPQRRRVRPAPG